MGRNYRRGRRRANRDDDTTNRGRGKSRNNNKCGNKGGNNRQGKRYYFSHYNPDKPGQTFQNNVDYLIQWTQRTYTYGYDVAASISSLKHIDMANHEPVCIISAKPPDKGGEVEQHGYDIVYQEEYRKYMN
jgi:hypothetical protein